MEPEDIILKLRQLLSNADCQVIISSLRQDALVWESLQNPTNSQKVLDAARTNPGMWSPAALFLIQFDNPALAVDLLNSISGRDSLQPLAHDLRQQSAQEYEKVYKSNQPPADLQQAGLLALALRERRHLKGSWQGFGDELIGQNDANTSYLLQSWRTPLACLYGMIPDSLEMLSGILPSASQDIKLGHISTILHAILSNPLSLDDQVNILTRFLNNFIPPLQLPWLQQLDFMGRSTLASHLALSLLGQPENAFYFAELKLEHADANHSEESSDPDTGESDCSFDPLLKIEPPDLIEMTRQLAEFYEYAGNSDQSISLLLDARDMTRRLQARITSQLAISAGSLQEDEVYINTWEQAHSLLPNSSTIQACLASAYLRANQTEETQTIVSDHCDDPLVQLAQAKLAAAQGNLVKAQEIGRLAFQKIVAHPPSNLAYVVLRQVKIHPHSEDIIQDLLDLNLVQEASELATLSLANQPVNLGLINLAIQVSRRAGKLAEAVELAQIGVTLEPENIAQHRLLAEFLEESQTWDLALSERQQVIELSTPPAIADLLALARCGLCLKKPAITLAVCQSILSENPEDGSAHHLHGKALLLSGSTQEAIDYFTQATLLIPEEPETWLDLSSAQAILGDSQKSLETLRAASLSNPNSAKIMAALGDASLANGSPTEALPPLRAAFELDPNSLPNALRLSDTLLRLGHYREARQVTEKIIQVYPQHPGLAYNYAQALLAGGEKHNALPYLFTAAQTPGVEAAPVIKLAQTVVDLVEEAQQPGGFNQVKTEDETSSLTSADFNLVVECLQGALAKDPENSEARMLLGEVLVANKQPIPAYDLFRKLAESAEGKDPEFYWRIQFGLGQTALANDQVDTALAALQEAASTNPENIEIQRTLAEAFHRASLFQESLQAARIVLKSAPLHLDNLIWFTHLMLDLKFLPEAINALTKAVELAPTQSDLLLLLGKIQFEAGDTSAAKQSFEGLKTLALTMPAELEEAASLFSKMDEVKKTIEFLELARQKQITPSYTTLVELAKAYDRSGNSKSAMEAVENAVALQKDDIDLCLLQSALYDKLERRQAALACLEHILQVITNNSALPSNQAAGALEQPYSSAEIHFRMARLLRSIGDIPTALGHAEEACQLAPENTEYRSLSAHLAYSLMSLDKASRLCQLPESQIDPEATVEEACKTDLHTVRLLCLTSELAFEKDDPSQVIGPWLITAARLSPGHPRVNALLTRLAKKNGELQNSEKYFNQAFSSLNQHQLLGNPAADQPSYESDPDSVWDILGTAEAALELGQWQVSLSLFQRAIEKLPLEARPRLRFARALVICAETQLTFQALNVKAHAPGEDRLNHTHYDLFEEAYLSANRLCQSTEVIRWHNRGQAVFHPGPQTARSLSNYITGPDDAAALIAAYRRSNQIAEAQKVAQTYFNHPDVLLQLNLALLETNLEASLAAVQTALELDVNNPILQAAYAYTISAEILIARQSIETALSFWPDEPEWHRFAAELSQKSGDILAAIAHWQQSVSLEPNSYEYNFALGSAYLASGNYPDAIKSLDLAVHINPFQAEAWYGLARANLQSGNFTEAMSCAEQTCDLSPNQVEPLLLAGEISLRLGQHEKAIAKSQAVQNLNPQNASAILLNARALSAMGSTQAALELIDFNLASYSQPTVLMLERIRLIKQLQGIQAALPDLQNLAGKNPNEPEVLTLLAQAQAETGQVDAAERTAQTSLKQLSTQPELHLLLGRIQRIKGQLDQAISHLSETIRQDPAQVEAYLELGKAYQDRRDHLQALKIYRQATQVAPNDPRPYYHAGLTLRESKDYLAAETMLRHAARLAPEDINIRRQLGAIITLNLVHHPQEASVIL